VRAALIADVHANLVAFEAVLAHARAHGGFDEVWCLGDIVGYGPRPAECIDLLRQLPHRAVAGNHDLAACGAMGVEEFNDAAARAALWTRERLDDERKRWLASLPHVERAGDFTLVHGTLRWPIWEYLLSEQQAAAQLALQETPYSAVGHSHLPFVAVEEAGRGVALRRVRAGEVVALAGKRAILNPGGVGQPRDGDPRAAYAVYDAEEGSVRFYRLPYDVAATQRQMEEARLPRWLIDRLAFGY
jgi:diadenosine tetraphosphatase ApaH/serine/threonine PP2A family protein phosphatase